MRTYRLEVAVACLLMCLTGAASACAQGGAPASPAPAPSAAAPPSVAPPSVVAASRPDRPDHVVVVVLENQDEHDVLDGSPYLASLAASGASLTDMHAETHPSQPNYLALFSGATQGVVDDGCPLTLGTRSLAGELVAAGDTFAGYAEDLPRPGYIGCTAADYARKHSPWTDFRDVPAAANQPFTAMPRDYANLPTVSFLIPNLCHDMHNCPIAVGDRWLSQNVDPFARWARTHNSLLIVTFDESESDSDRDNHIATLAVGQRVTPGPITERTDHYRLLRTLEDLYRLPPLGHSAQTTAIGGLWRSGP